MFDKSSRILASVYKRLQYKCAQLFVLARQRYLLSEVAPEAWIREAFQHRGSEGADPENSKGQPGRD
jgi:hypothetical protein